MVELESAANVRFLHTRSDAQSLHAIAGLGGAGRGGPADDAHYLWPKYAAGMTYDASIVDSLFGQAFYRPSRSAIALSRAHDWGRELRKCLEAVVARKGLGVPRSSGEVEIIDVPYSVLFEHLNGCCLVRPCVGNVLM